MQCIPLENVADVKYSIKKGAIEFFWEYDEFDSYYLKDQVAAKDSEYEVTTATTIEEAKPILAAGFEYVTEKNGIMLFRKPKRFMSVEM